MINKLVSEFTNEDVKILFASVNETGIVIT